MAASRKVEKYVDLGACYIFEPVAVESLGIFNASAHHLLHDLGISELVRLERQLPVPKNLDIGAAFQCCPST